MYSDLDQLRLGRENFHFSICSIIFPYQGILSKKISAQKRGSLTTTAEGVGHFVVGTTQIPLFFDAAPNQERIIWVIEILIVPLNSYILSLSNICCYLVGVGFLDRISSPLKSETERKEESLNKNFNDTRWISYKDYDNNDQVI